MGKMSNFMENFFFEKEQESVFDGQRYIRDLESGVFRDRWNLGVLKTGGGQWLLKDFVQEPNAIFTGAMGSGKSVAAAFSCITWMAANSDKTIMFVCDVVKGAGDYAALFNLPNVYTSLNESGYDAEEGVRRIIDLVSSESSSRQEMFNEVGATNISAYEQITGKKMARIITVIEEFHSTPEKVMEFKKNFKKKYSTAEKFFTLMKIGRSQGIWFIAASQKGTSSDVPTEIINNFTQKQIGKVSVGEATYMLGKPDPAYIDSSMKGRMFTEYGEVQFPALSKQHVSGAKLVEEIKNSSDLLLKTYAKPFDAECSYLNDSLIRDYLNGKSPKELYKTKKLTELAESIESQNGELVVEVIHDKLGWKWEKLNSRTDLHGLCAIATDLDGKKYSVLYEKTKVSGRHLSSLMQGAKKNCCSGGILYSPLIGMPSSIYKIAKEHGLLILDYNDIVRLSRQIDDNRIDLAQQMFFDIANNDNEDEEFAIENEQVILPKKQVKPKPKSPLEDLTPEERRERFLKSRPQAPVISAEEIVLAPPYKILEKLRAKHIAADRIKAEMEAKKRA